MISAGVSFAEALAEARDALKESPTSALDARVLLEHVTGLTRAELIAIDKHPIGSAIAEAFTRAVRRRHQGEPVAYITGEQEFFGLKFAVSPEVLIPRPESEMLVEAAIHYAPDRILDLGTGSGCLLAACLASLPSATGVGIDISKDALHMAERNIAALGLQNRAHLAQSTFQSVADDLHDAQFDVILANPPYIAPSAELPTSVGAYEPPFALFADDDGLAAHREVAAAIARLLRPGGAAFVEIGHDQGVTAPALYAETLPFCDVRTKEDMSAHPRMVAICPKPGL